MEGFVTNFMVDVDGRYEVPTGQVLIRDDISFVEGDKICLQVNDVIEVIEKKESKKVVVYQEPTDDFFGVRAKSELII